MITTTLHPAFNAKFDNDVDGIRIDHNKLLADLVECNLPLVSIARDHKLNLAQLIAWAAQPGVRSLLDAADELARRIAAHKAAQGAPAALQTLIGQASGLCETVREQDIANRAARAVLRFSPLLNRERPKPASVPTRLDRLKSLLNRAGSDNGAAETLPPSPSLREGEQSPLATASRTPTAAPSLRFPAYPFRPEPQ